MTTLPRTLLCALFVASASGEARAEDHAAFQSHYDSAMALIRTKDFRGAIREFEVAYAAEPDPSALFNIGLAYRLLALQGAPGQFTTTEDAQRAMDNFGLYLDRHRALHGNDPNDLKTVERYQGELKEKFGVKEPARAPVVEPVGPNPPPPPPPPEAPGTAPKTRVILGGVLVGVGVAAAAVGAGLLVASAADGKAPDIASSGDFASRASTFGVTGGVLAGIGAAAVVGGVVALLLPGKSAETTTARIVPMPGGLAVAGRF